MTKAHPDPSAAWRTRFRGWVDRPYAAADATLRVALHDENLLPAALLRSLSVQRGRALVVCADSQRADQLSSALCVLMPLIEDSREVIQVPEVVETRRGHWIPENEAARCAALEAALSGRAAVFVVTVEGLLSSALDPDGFAEMVFTLKLGDEWMGPGALARRLVSLDYDNEAEVHAPGEFSHRGGIVDVYSPLYDAPVRIEFFGDEIESMRFFMPDSQRSFGSLDELRIVPRGAIVADLESDDSSRFWDYFSRSPVAVSVCSPRLIRDHLERFAHDGHLASWESLSTDFESCVELVTEAAEVTEEPGWTTVPFDGVALKGDIAEVPADLADALSTWRWQQLRDALTRWHRGGYALVACCAGEGECERFREMLDEDPQTASLPIAIEYLPLEAGLFIPSAKLVLLSEEELFGRHPDVRRRRRSRYRHEEAFDEAMDLEEGAYAVHASHGICLYHGVQELEVHGELQEVMVLEFDDEARLYVPVDQAFLVSRYVAGSKRLPKLSRLGGASWSTAKENAAEAAWDLAAELLRLEALRRNAEGVSFKRIEDWERSFAQAFPYTETEDQSQAIGDVLADMQSEEPMDRLLCGDVGYGKTEVAMRAAFRSVLNGKQVAVLVPTTVLAQQHVKTFRERMAEYPVVIDMLSRFRTKGEQRRILERLAEGQVDIIIGTHRLLQKDVQFSDLGLVIIDEEQRFGVRHKQKLKQMRASVDILTMTATPIPRTLYFSLSGLRNLSTIMTAPDERLPVTTVVAYYDRDLIRQAIMRELERQGQVFFLHNRVQSIAKAAHALRDLVPEARIGVGHGQMTAHSLAEVMSEFLGGDIDVLVCTTIIESGLDIPNANTIIIDRADRFGLAELYQLRGRVGRYHRQAYAYLLLPPMGALPENAKQRLQAIRKYTHLGAGFKLALRDLEIRGAGNILGTEQSGHIAAVGFDLYCQLLEDAVAHLEDRPAPVRELLPLELDTLTFGLRDAGGRALAAIPAAYVMDEGQRLECYRRLARTQTRDEMTAFAEELRDRFGPLPTCTELLLAAARVRAVARAAGVHSISVREGRALMESDRGLLKNSKGRVPELDAADAMGQLKELERFLAVRG